MSTLLIHFIMPPRRYDMGTNEETTGERLVRIEVLLASMKEALVAHMVDEEKALNDTRSLITDHIKSTGTVGEDLRAMRRDMHDMQGRMKALETEVQTLTKNKTWVMAWAAGAGSVVTAFVGLAIWFFQHFLKFT